MRSALSCLRPDDVIAGKARMQSLATTAGLGEDHFPDCGFRSTSKRSFASEIMFSVQQFFSQDRKFFDLLEASADETRALTRLLIELLKDRSHPHPLHEFALARGNDKRITE